MKKLIAMVSAGVLFVSGMCFAEAVSQVPAGDYIFTSGVGAWRNELALEENLSFSGCYSDSEMGDTGEGYEYGSCYVCSYTGQFSTPQDAGNGTCEMTVEQLVFEEEPGTESIEDEIRYVYDEAYGISQGDVFIYYPEGFATADMDENALEWATLTGGWGFDSIPDTIPYGVLYNTTQGYAFSAEFSA